jgi:hypothetical protein
MPPSRGTASSVPPGNSNVNDFEKFAVAEPKVCASGDRSNLKIPNLCNGRSWSRRPQDVHGEACRSRSQLNADAKQAAF